MSVDEKLTVKNYSQTINKFCTTYDEDFENLAMFLYPVQDCVAILDQKAFMSKVSVQKVVVLYARICSLEWFKTLSP